VTVVVPIGKTEPGDALPVVTAPGQLSVPTGGVQNALAPDGHVGSRVWLDGQLICGGSVSFTVTVCWQLDVLPELSVAVHVMVVVPTG
jgi:hypothetical protein